MKTLQLEQMAVMGHTEEASLVASRMSLVFSTLEVRAPALSHSPTTATAAVYKFCSLCQSHLQLGKGIYETV